MPSSKEQILDCAANWYYQKHGEGFASWYRARDHAETIYDTISEDEPDQINQLMLSDSLADDVAELFYEYDVTYWEQ